MKDYSPPSTPLYFFFFFLVGFIRLFVVSPSPTLYSSVTPILIVSALYKIVIMWVIIFSPPRPALFVYVLSLKKRQQNLEPK